MNTQPGATPAQQSLRRVEIMSDALAGSWTDEIALLDNSGQILSVNDAWVLRGKEAAPGLVLRSSSGGSYPDALRASAEGGFESAQHAVDGLRSVLRGASGQFHLEYQADSQNGGRWFSFTATALAHLPGAMITHHEVTARRKVEALQSARGETTGAGLLFESLIPALVRNLALALDVRRTFLSERLDRDRARVIVHWNGTGFDTAYEHPIAGIPAELVLRGQTIVYPSGLQTIFPNQSGTPREGAESYIAVPVFDAHGDPIGILGLLDTKPLESVALAETTLAALAARLAPELERRSAVRRLEELSRYLEYALDAVIVTDANFAVKYWNRGAEATYGWTAAEVVGRPLADALSSDFTPEQRAEARRRLLEFGVRRVETVHRRKDGSHIDVEATMTVLRGPDRDVVGIVTVNRDISEHKRAEETLRQAEYKTRAILEAIPDMMFTLDGAGRFLSFTPARDLDPLVEPSAFLGKRVDEVMPPDLVPVITRAVGACVRTGQPQTFEYQILQVDEPRDYECRLVLLGPNEVLSVVRDITAQKQLERGEGLPGMVKRSVTRPGRRTRVLVVDQDVHALRFLRRALQHRGHEAVVTSDPAEAPALHEAEEYDLILLDMAVPGAGGLDLFLRLRRISDAPVIVLAAIEEEEEAIRALRLGAADFVRKPLSPEELDVRVEAVLARRQAAHRADSRPRQFGDLTIDFAKRLVSRDGNPVALTATEYRLLHQIAAEPGRVLTHDEILEDVWGPGYEGQYDLLRSFVRTLRRKLGDDGRQPRLIMAVRGVGYQMTTPSA